MFPKVVYLKIFHYILIYVYLDSHLFGAVFKPITGTLRGIQTGFSSISDVNNIEIRNGEDVILR